MMHLRLADVSDGLCAELRFPDGAAAQVDCGSAISGAAADAWLRILAANPTTPSFGPDTFILTHLHTDHYNGVLDATNSPSFPRLANLRRVVTAGVPRTPDRSMFLRAAFAASFRVLGSDSGHMRYDFLKAVHQLNGGQCISFRQVFQNDTVEVGGARLQCIWPPREIDDSRFARSLEKALAKFDAALEADPFLREIHERVEGQPHLQGLEMEPAGAESESRSIEFGEDDLRSPPLEDITPPRTVPPETKQANKALTDLANQLSLALRAGTSLLIWGDVGEPRLRPAIEFLRSVNAIDVDCMVAPHHGTYWNPALLNLRSGSTLISHGPKLLPKYKHEWAEISGAVRSTHLEGDICVQLWHW